jgi:phage shock protein PspC (stress-responsive transcriptional regulator)
VNDETPSMPERESSEAPTEDQRPEDAGGNRRLMRSSSERVLAGVAGGLGRYFGIDPIIFRIGFALSIFFGGLGIVAYLLLALFVPTDGDPDAAQRFGLQSAGVWRGLGLAAIALIASAARFGLACAGAFAVGLGWGVPVAILIIAVGLLLVLAAVRGGARWLIPPAVALAIGGGVAAASDLDLRGGIGKRDYHPASVDSIPVDGYRLGVGRLVVDLRDLPWKERRVVNLDVSVGMGQADVFVPEAVCVSGSSHVGAGQSEIAGERNDGVDVDHTVGEDATAVPRLEIDASVDVGQLRVINSDTAHAGTDGPESFHGDTNRLRAAQTRACGTQ